MGKTIVVLLIVLIIRSVAGVISGSKILSKDSCVNFHKEKLKQAELNNATNGVRGFAFLICLTLDVFIIYKCIDVIFFFVN